MYLSSLTGDLVEPLTGRRWTGPEIRSRVVARAEALRRAGVNRGDRVFLHYGNVLEFFVDLLAIWRRGACAVPVDGRLTAFEIGHLARAAAPRVSIWAESPEATIVSALDGVGTRILPIAPSVRAEQTGEDEPPAGFGLDDEALILFTSGTTGDPKGVVHTHRSLRARWFALASSLGLDAYRKTLCLLPTHFGHGLICNSLFPWLHGRELHVLPPFRADLLVRLGEIIDQQGITFMSSVPTVWRLATRTAAPPKRGTLKRVFCGSAPLSGGLWRTVQQWCGVQEVCNAYGITETGSWLAGSGLAIDEPEDGLVGAVWGGAIRVLEGRDTSIAPSDAKDCAPGESGHIWVSTPALMKGYLGRDDLTAQVVSEGWFATGDVGTFDERGRLYIRGREREDINKGGMKVHPSDIDAVIERFDRTLDVCTFALADPLLGEDVGVAVVLSDPGQVTIDALHRWCRAHLAVHQMPRRLYVVEEIPRTSRGKVNRSRVAEFCSMRTAAAFGATGPRQQP